MGLRQASLGELAQNTGLKNIQTQYELGKQQQAQQQATLEAKRQSDLAQLYEPYQRLSYLSDIYKGAPSTQQTIATSTSPSVSPAQQFMGLGIAGLSAAAGANKAGLFG
jgi:cell shape-determining protein MreC